MLSVHHLASLAILAGLVLSGVALPQEIRLGTEFQVNTHTVSEQNYPSAAASADGAFVVAWASYLQDGHRWGVFARRFSSAGSPLAVEVQVNTFTTETQRRPDVATDGNGDVIVVWESLLQEGSAGGVFAQRFEGTGSPVGIEFQVNTVTTLTQSRPSVAMGQDGDFVVAWESDHQDGSNYGVFAQLFASNGAPVAAELQVNTITADHQRRPSVAAQTDGDFVVAWESFGQDGDDFGVFARRFSSAGVALAAELQVNVFTVGAQGGAAVATDAEGDFVVAWESFGQDGSELGVFARRFSSAGTPVATEFPVNAHTNEDQGDPEVVVGPDGDFVVAWESYLQDGDQYARGVFARRFSSAGTPQAVEFQVNTATVYDERRPAAAIAANGYFVVAWGGREHDGSSWGVFAQRFATPSFKVLDIDANGSVAALSDGLLVLRYLFGFTGDTLVTGAVDLGSCTRCEAAAVEAYLATLI